MYFGTLQTAAVHQHEDDTGWFFGDFNSSSKKDGKGTLHFKDGSFFEGLWSDDKPREGAFVDLDGHFSYGNFKGNFLVSGGFEGKVEYANGNLYTGVLEDFFPHGYGLYQTADGSKYEGMWKRGKRTGYGEFTNRDGTRNCGNWTDQEHNDQLFDLSFCNAGLSGSAVAHTLASVSGMYPQSHMHVRLTALMMRAQILKRVQFLFLVCREQTSLEFMLLCWTSSLPSHIWTFLAIRLSAMVLLLPFFRLSQACCFVHPSSFKF